MMRVAVLDDYQGAALHAADWQSLHPAVQIEAFPGHIADQDALARRLHTFECVVLMRERTPFPKSLIERLPNLRLIVSAGMRNAALDVEAATARGIQVCGTEMLGYPTAELAWGLVIALMRRIPRENAAIRSGTWQLPLLGNGLQGKTLGVVGLGRLGSQVASYGKLFRMNVVAWSQNLTDEKAAEHGARRVGKDELFAASDVISIHLVLSERSRGLVGAADLARMKKTAYLVNTSRGPIVDEAALLDCLGARRIGGAALDVYNVEPVRKDHPFLALDNVILTPHLGYATEEAYHAIYSQTVEAIRGFLDGKPVRPLNKVA
jgi:phosphoglycerate dehydrogenase-like enzyme